MGRQRKEAAVVIGARKIGDASKSLTFTASHDRVLLLILTFQWLSPLSLLQSGACIRYRREHPISLGSLLLAHLPFPHSPSMSKIMMMTQSGKTFAETARDVTGIKPGGYFHTIFSSSCSISSSCAECKIHTIEASAFLSCTRAACTAGLPA